MLLYFFSSLLLLSGLAVISAKNPVHSVFYLIFLFLNATAILLIVGIEFMAILFLVVYIGAIAILFLFVVMMLNIKWVEFNESIIRYIPVGALIGVYFLIQLYQQIDYKTFPTLTNTNQDWLANFYEWSSIKLIGNLIYTDYSLLLELAGLILVLAMIGAILLTLEHHNNIRRQDLYLQIETNYQSTIKHFK